MEVNCCIHNSLSPELAFSPIVSLKSVGILSTHLHLTLTGSCLFRLSPVHSVYLKCLIPLGKENKSECLGCLLQKLSLCMCQRITYLSKSHSLSYEQMLYGVEEHCIQFIDLLNC
jgi:hypothetical protein